MLHFCCYVHWLPVVGSLCYLVACIAFLLRCSFAVLPFGCYVNGLPAVGCVAVLLFCIFAMLHFAVLPSCCYVNWFPVCRALMLTGCRLLHFGRVAVLLCCMFAVLHFALLHFSGDVNWLPVSFAVLYFLLLCSLVACCRVLMLPGFLYCIFAALQFCCVAFWLLC